MKNKIFKKLFKPYILKRIYLERLGEPIIYNFISLFVLIFGNIRSKIKYDLVPRESYAYGILEAADLAKSHNINKISIIEFGVASGNGLLNMCYIANKVTKLTGVEFEIFGFDSGQGMPAPLDYRDHPEKYFTGDFPPIDQDKLISNLPKNAKLILGDIKKSLFEIEKQITSPIGFVSVDVDYYSSTLDCLNIFQSDTTIYLPYVFTYFDDVYDIDDNDFCGELLAIKEFNNKNTLRKITKATMLNQKRIFRRSPWTHQIYLTHIFDHKARSIEYIRERKSKVSILENPFI
ncbi:hypothetical protein N9A30_03040 [Flavobacteriaceae bacterium]|nr:hypothetical protein [Flavobacteriaceae bacterium]